MYPRKPHQKTRTGCVTCKRRRIKCDETKPCCLNCMKMGLDCAYQPVPPPATSRSKSRALGRQRPALDTSFPSGSTLGRQPDIMFAQAYNSFSRDDLRLFHHFSHFTSHTVTDQTPLQKLWQFEIPMIALKHDFLLNGLLAVSALHIAHGKTRNNDLEGRDELYKAAAHWQGQALSLYRVNMGSITVANCHALFAFSLLLVCQVFAVPRNEGGTFHADGQSERRTPSPLTPKSPGSSMPMRPDDGLPPSPTCVPDASTPRQSGSLLAEPEWIRLVRGARLVIHPAIPWIAQGPLKDFLYVNARTWTTTAQPETEQAVEYDARLRSLEDLWRREGEACRQPEKLEMEQRLSYLVPLPKAAKAEAVPPAGFKVTSCESGSPVMVSGGESSLNVNHGGILRPVGTISTKNTLDPSRPVTPFTWMISPERLVDREAELLTYNRALLELRITFARLSQPMPKTKDPRLAPQVPIMSSVFLWLFALPEAYVDLLETRQTPALILMAHFAMLLHRLEDVWMFEGIGRDLVASVCEMVEHTDGGKWDKWLEWPKEYIGIHREWP